MRITNPQLDKAQDLMWTAMDSCSKAERIKLSKKALKICPDCADAYVFLSADLDFSSRAEKINFLEEGVKAGRRALGTHYFKKDVGSFWLILETRPYMRALCALACELEADGQTDAAISHCFELLRLNPYDNQGIRYLLIPLLVWLNRLKEAAELLKKFGEDDCGVWTVYSRALMHFKQGGNTKTARKALAKAVACNHFVVYYLLDANFDPDLPTSGYYSPADKTEAYGYVRDWRKDWYDTKGAIGWLLASLIDGYLDAEAPKELNWRRKDLSDLYKN